MTRREEGSRRMRQLAGARLGILILLLGCGCSGADTSAGTGAASSPGPASAAGAATLEPTPVACDPLPDMPEGRIAYTQVREDGSTAIYLMKPDGTEKRCLVDTAGPDAAPAWSPDGRSLAFQGGTAEQEDIYTVRADGTGLRQLTDTPEWEASPVWSPDGRRIAYSRSRMPDDPPWTIRVMSTDGSHDAPILSSGHEVVWAEMRDWSPDARTLLIATDNGGGLDLVEIRPDGTDLKPLRAAAGDFGSGARY